MEFRIKKEIIVEALTEVQSITKKHTSMFILSNVLLSVEGEKICIRATDLEIASKALYEAEIEEVGELCVPSKKLYSIVKAFPSGVISMKELDNKWLLIAGEKIECNLIGMDVGDFPNFTDMEDVDLFEIPDDILVSMIKKTIYSVSDSEGRANISGICFEKSEDSIRMVSTDGHRLSKIEHSVDGGFVLEKGVIIPKDGVVEMLKILKSGEMVKIGFKNSNLFVMKDDRILAIRLIETDFIDYELVVPKNLKIKMKVEKKAFLNLLKRMCIFMSDNYFSAVFVLKKDQLMVTMVNPEIGEVKEKINIDYSGKPLEIGFNPKYFLDTLECMESEEVVVGFVGVDNPCTVKGNSDPGFLSVIMSCRKQ